MKRFIKGVLVAGGMAAVGFQGYKSYRLLYNSQESQGSASSLCRGKIWGEATVGFSLSVNLVVQLQLKLTFSPEFLKENPDLEEKLKADVSKSIPSLKSATLQFMVVDSSMSKIDISRSIIPRSMPSLES
jgi:hypothetical protein